MKHYDDDTSQRMCEGKRAYTKKDAQSMLNLRRSRLRGSRRELRMYHCPRCNFWHLTDKEYGTFHLEA